MIVDSKLLDEGARALRERGVSAADLACGVNVTQAQLRKAAELLREAEPSIITSATTKNVSFNADDIGVPQERPGFIAPEHQDDPKVLTLAIGMFPQETYRISRRGKVLS